jgi:hypothetical protein
MSHRRLVDTKTIFAYSRIEQMNNDTDISGVQDHIMEEMG